VGNFAKALSSDREICSKDDGNREIAMMYLRCLSASHYQHFPIAFVIMTWAWAVARGDVEVVGSLLYKGANMFAQSGMVPLIYAVMNRDIEAVRLRSK